MVLWSIIPTNKISRKTSPKLGKSDLEAKQGQMALWSIIPPCSRVHFHLSNFSNNPFYIERAPAVVSWNRQKSKLYSFPWMQLGELFHLWKAQVWYESICMFIRLSQVCALARYLCSSCHICVIHTNANAIQTQIQMKCKHKYKWNTNTKWYTFREHLHVHQTVASMRYLCSSCQICVPWNAAISSVISTHQHTNTNTHTDPYRYTQIQNKNSWKFPLVWLHCKRLSYQRPLKFVSRFVEGFSQVI